jgi:hypothetical protein
MTGQCSAGTLARERNQRPPVVAKHRSRTSVAINRKVREGMRKGEKKELNPQNRSKMNAKPFFAIFAAALSVLCG